MNTSGGSLAKLTGSPLASLTKYSLFHEHSQKNIHFINKKGIWSAVSLDMGMVQGKKRNLKQSVEFLTR